MERGRIRPSDLYARRARMALSRPEANWLCVGADPVDFGRGRDPGSVRSEFAAKGPALASPGAHAPRTRAAEFRALNLRANSLFSHRMSMPWECGIMRAVFGPPGDWLPELPSLPAMWSSELQELRAEAQHSAAERRRQPAKGDAAAAAAAAERARARAAAAAAAPPPTGGGAKLSAAQQARLDALKSKHGNYADNLKAQAAGGGPQPAPRR